MTCYPCRSRWRTGIVPRCECAIAVGVPTMSDISAFEEQRPGIGNISRKIWARGSFDRAAWEADAQRGWGWRVVLEGVEVLLLPSGERMLHARLVCAHIMGAGHCTVRTTTHCLGVYCVWNGGRKMWKISLGNVTPRRDRRTGNVFPRPLSDRLYGTKAGDVLHYDRLSMKKS